jgi:DoxX-like family
MKSAIPPGTPSKKLILIGRLVSAVPVLMIFMSAVMKFMAPPQVVQGFAHLGFSPAMAVNLGILELVCLAVYLVPATSVLGAILLTGYLGGAVDATYRVGDSWLMPLALGVLLWGGLYLRDSRLRVLIPLKR